MKKLCFAIMILAGVSVVSCSSDDDDHTQVGLWIRI